MEIRRNDPCPCNSGKKYKKCCGQATPSQRDAPTPAAGHTIHKDVSTLVREGDSLRNLGRPDEALAAYHQALQVDPEYAPAHNGIGIIHSIMGRPDQALQSYEKALQFKPDFGSALYNYGNTLQEMGRYDEAVKAYEKAERYMPGDGDVLTNMGVALVKADRFDEAITAFKRALELNPADMLAYKNWAGALIDQGDFVGAEKLLLRTLVEKPDQVELCISMADLYESMNRVDDAGLYVDRALAQDPGNPAAGRIKAALLRRRKKPEEGLTQLSQIPVPEHDRSLAMTMHYELGRLYDAVELSDAAMRHFTVANTLAADLVRGEKQNYLNMVTDISQWFARRAKDLHKLVASATSREEPPVFLVGFPRSGTTLLTAILDSHPDLQVLDEKPMLVKVLQQLRGQNETEQYPEILLNLTDTELASLRELYWHEAQKYGAAPGLRLIDKQPLNIVHCNLIARLFPTARIILSLRHPCDVCLSCFMQHFRGNDAMANFTSLAETVQLYAEIMGLGLEYEKNLSLPFHRFRYEGLIEKFEDEMNAIVDFLGISWSDTFYQHHKHAAGKEVITTASYAQVVEPIYTTAKYRWLRYRTHLEPLLPALRPFIEAFGYRES